MTEKIFIRDLDLSDLPTDDLWKIGQWLEQIAQKPFPRFTNWLHSSLVIEMERRRKDPFEPPHKLPDFRHAPDEVVGEILLGMHLLVCAEGITEKTAVEFLDNLANSAAAIAAARLGFTMGGKALTNSPETVN